MTDARDILSRVGREHRVAVLEALRMIRDDASLWRDDWGTAMRDVDLAELIREMEGMR